MKATKSVNYFTCLFTLYILITLVPQTISAQIQYQTSFNFSGSFVKLEDEGYKFYIMDVPQEQCRIYNEDFTLWKTVQMNIPSNRYLTDIAYISQYLFDADPGVEMLYVYYQYAQTATSYYYIYTTSVIDDNQTLMLEVPGASWNEVKKTSEGTKLLSYVYDYSVYPYTVQTRVYRLPGVWSGIPETIAPEDLSFDPVFPNPAQSSVFVKVPDPFAIEPATLVVTDLLGALILRQPITQSIENIDLQSIGLASGTYLIRLESAKLQTKFQQIVVTK